VILKIRENAIQDYYIYLKDHFQSIVIVSLSLEVFQIKIMN
jgi:hypothetical protein